MTHPNTRPANSFARRVRAAVSPHSHPSDETAARPLRALDLFCGAGGATRGLQLAGFHVTGVDIKPQKNYCGDAFFQADALNPPVDLRDFDFIWASPPCQAYSIASQSRRNAGHEYPDLLAPTRAMLEASGVPWVIENVPGAPMRGDLSICGCQVGLELRRKRWFETSWKHFDLAHPCHHMGPVVSVVGHGTPTWVRKKLGFNPTIKHYRDAMGISWMNRDELSLAIPPAYSEFIARAFLSQARPIPTEAKP